MPDETNEMIRPGENARRAGSLYEMAEVLSSAVLCIAVLFTFVLRFAGVLGISMTPTLENKQWLAVTAILPQPERGDIVIISPRNGHHEPLVKRVIAVGGDEIDFAGGRVLLNGAVIEEPYLPEDLETYPANEYQASMPYPARVPAGYVFVMGDNRGVSSDSRAREVGFVRADDILGKVLFRVKPFLKKIA
ncbi:MAG: signal peptidase I [Firmicutes bacterium]|nr:signal peptidase I [Bacillota bacterium]